MLVMAVYAAIRKQTEKMQVCAVFQAVIDGIVEFLHLEKIPVLNRLGDPGQLLIYDAARADVQGAPLPNCPSARPAGPRTCRKRR